MNALFDAMRRGLDFQRASQEYSIHPYPPMVGALNTFAPLQSGVLHISNNAPAPNVLAGVGQFGILPKDRG